MPPRKKNSTMMLPSPSKNMIQPTMEDHILFKPDWSLLPEELLHHISEKLDDCFDVIHARSVCRPWRSVFPFPSCLIPTSYSLPSFSQYDPSFKGVQSPSCTLEKFPLFFFKVRTPGVVDELPSVFFVGGINQDKSEGDMELQSPLQCSVKVKIPESEPILLNVLHCQILLLSYQFRMVGWDPNSNATSFNGVAFLPLDKEGGKEFVVLISYSGDLFVLRSSEMRWMRLERYSIISCVEIVAFRGKFYVHSLINDVYVIDPYSLKSTPLIHSERLASTKHLVPSGNDELFLVEGLLFRGRFATDMSKFQCRVSRLDEDARQWVVVTNLGDRVLLVGQPRNSSCATKELPDGCGVSGNSFVFTSEVLNQASIYKYGVDTGSAEDNLNLWRCSRENVVTILNTSPMMALRVERSDP